MKVRFSIMFMKVKFSIIFMKVRFSNIFMKVRFSMVFYANEKGLEVGCVRPGKATVPEIPTAVDLWCVALFLFGGSQ